jgi:hypothetical protein
VTFRWLGLNFNVTCNGFLLVRDVP